MAAQLLRLGIPTIAALFVGCRRARHVLHGSSPGPLPPDYGRADSSAQGNKYIYIISYIARAKIVQCNLLSFSFALSVEDTMR